MVVKAAFFGGLRRELGARERTIEVDRDTLTVEELVEELVERYPSLRSHLATIVYSVGDEVVDPDYSLTDGDLVGLLPPVSGG